MTIFFKKFKKPYLGAILGTFCPNLGKNKFSCKKGLCQSLNISIIYDGAKNQKKTNNPFLSKLLKFVGKGSKKINFSKVKLSLSEKKKKKKKKF